MRLRGFDVAMFVGLWLFFAFVFMVMDAILPIIEPSGTFLFWASGSAALAVSIVVRLAVGLLLGFSFEEEEGEEE